MLVTTHYLDEARHCDETLFILKGKVVARGTPSQLMGDTGTSNMEDAFLALTRTHGLKPANGRA